METSKQMAISMNERQRAQMSSDKCEGQPVPLSGDKQVGNGDQRKNGDGHEQVTVSMNGGQPNQHNWVQINKWGQIGTSKRTEMMRESRDLEWGKTCVLVDLVRKGMWESVSRYGIWLLGLRYLVSGVAQPQQAQMSSGKYEQGLMGMNRGLMRANQHNQAWINRWGISRDNQGWGLSVCPSAALLLFVSYFILFTLSYVLSISLATSRCVVK